MNRTVPAGTRPQRYTQILLVDDAAGTAIPAEHPTLRALSRVNPDEMTPMQALAKIAELKKSLDRTSTS
jgi:hypothetical protein